MQKLKKVTDFETVTSVPAEERTRQLGTGFSCGAPISKGSKRWNSAGAPPQAIEAPTTLPYGKFPLLFISSLCRRFSFKLHTPVRRNIRVKDLFFLIIGLIGRIMSS